MKTIFIICILALSGCSKGSFPVFQVKSPEGKLLPNHKVVLYNAMYRFNYENGAQLPLNYDVTKKDLKGAHHFLMDVLTTDKDGLLKIDKEYSTMTIIFNLGDNYKRILVHNAEGKFRTGDYPPGTKKMTGFYHYNTDKNNISFKAFRGKETLTDLKYMPLQLTEKITKKLIPLQSRVYGSILKKDDKSEQ
ncbi:MAG: hypothetical protein HRT89_07060 [Lentisphaeria bacterium]|nr:hypothetical protein [Lentisphaeria bacterium]NQZ67812.1 hypothetical protein [Lentisphaeria bacterium]